MTYNVLTGTLSNQSAKQLTLLICSRVDYIRCMKSLTRFVAEKVFIHQKVHLNWTVFHYFRLNLFLVGVHLVL